jgi:replicative DNA helicase
MFANAKKELAERAENDGTVTGLRTTLGKLDAIISGLNKSELILLAARAATGKTALGVMFALQAALDKPQSTVLYYTLEMSAEQIALRMLSSYAWIDSRHVRVGKLTEEERKKLDYAGAQLSETGLRINDAPNVTVADIAVECRKYKDLSLVVIDYLQLMDGGKHGTRAEAVSDISRRLKQLARSLNIPIVCLCQLNRENAKRENKKPLLTDLRESGSLEQDADIVLGLYRESAINPQAENQTGAELLVLKNRHGATGSVPLTWLPEYTYYAETETRSSAVDADGGDENYYKYGRRGRK